jgi:AcrR family transcriptional regulator
MRDIARNLGINKNTVISHFKKNDKPSKSLFFRPRGARKIGSTRGRASLFDRMG